MPKSNDGPVRVMPFVMVFAVTYAILTLVVLVFVTLLGLPSNSGLAIGSLIGAATFAASRFSAEIGRPPQGPETMKLAVLSLAAVILMSVPLTLAALAFTGVTFSEFTAVVSDIFGKLDTATTVGIIAFTAAFHLAGLYFSYGPLARIIAHSTRK